MSSTVYVSLGVERCICFGSFLCAVEFDVSRVTFRARLLKIRLITLAQSLNFVTVGLLSRG